MKPVLVIGIGNPLMGDDGIGCAVAERLANHTHLPGGVEVVFGGTDLLRYAGQIAGRTRVVVIDAFQQDGEPGRVAWLRGGLNEHQPDAHRLSAVQAIALLQMTTPVRIDLLGISISSAAAAPCLSPALAARVPAIVECVIHALAGQTSSSSSV